MQDRDAAGDSRSAAARRWQRASALFDEWLDLEPAALAERLADLRASEPGVALELERMIAADRAGGLLDDGVAGVSPTLVDELRAPPVAVPALAPGATVGPYRLQGLLGRGGMGDVYRAERQGADYTQVVALKLLRRGVDGDDARRFAQERRILARLEHPGIARLIDGGVAPEGPWLAMELVEGEPLTTYAKRKALGLRERVELLVTVCEALDYAHRRLVVHRDLKPSNVLVAADGAPRLLDFGIAKLLDAGVGDELTRTGVRVLSPAYAAPEQVAGEPVGITTDVYALGLLLYELLTGELPQGRREHALAALPRALQAEPERPSAMLRRARGPETSLVARALEGDLDTIVLKALAVEPDRRYASAAAMAEDLRRHLDGRPIAARPDTMSYRLGKFVRRHRGGVVVALVATLAIVCSLVVALWQGSVARSEAGRATREATAAQESALRTRRVKDFMMETFTQADPLRTRPAGPQTLAEAVDNAIARIDSELGDDPRLQGDLLDDFGEIRLGQGRSAEARAMFERALALAEAAYGSRHPAVAESLLNLVAVDASQERFLEATARGERALAILEQHADTEPLALVEALETMSVLRKVQGHRTEAVRYSARALEIQRAHGAPDDPQLARALHNHGSNLNDAGRPDEAEPLLRESLALRERELGADNPTLDYTLGALSLILYERGKYEESSALTERRVAIARKSFPGDHAWKAGALADLGWERVEAKRLPEGIALLEESAAIYGRLGSPEAMTPLRYLALAQRRTGDHVAALAAIDRAWQVCGEHGALAFCSVVRANRAGMLVDAGRAEEGLAESDAAIAAFRAMDREDDNDIGQALESRARALAALGRRAEARAAQSEALAIYVRIYGEDHRETARVRANLDKLDAAPSRVP